MASALKSIPSLSLVLNRDDFFKTGQGIYPKGEGVEKATSVELIYPKTQESNQADGSVQIVKVALSPRRVDVDGHEDG